MTAQVPDFPRWEEEVKRQRQMLERGMATSDLIDLENLENQLVRALHAVWRIQGKRCKVVQLK